MRSLSLLSVLLFACTGTSEKEDSSGETGVTEQDSDTTTTTTTDSGTTSAPIGKIEGTAIAYDGTIPVDMTVQICATVCFSVKTDGTGKFSKDGLKATGYKVEAMGYVVEGQDYGDIRMHVELGADEQFSIPAPLFVPQVTGPVVNSGKMMTLGNVSFQADPSVLKVPFGEDDNTFWAGVVDGANIPPFWGLTDPTAAVAFVPLGTEVSGEIVVGVSGEYAAGEYDVYSVDEHGSVEGPVGTATSDGASLTAKSLTPTILSWLIFVPKM